MPHCHVKSSLGIILIEVLLEERPLRDLPHESCPFDEMPYENGNRLSTISQGLTNFVDNGLFTGSQSKGGSLDLSNVNWGGTT